MFLFRGSVCVCMWKQASSLVGLFSKKKSDWNDLACAFNRDLCAIQPHLRLVTHRWYIITYMTFNRHAWFDFCTHRWIDPDAIMAYYIIFNFIKSNTIIAFLFPSFVYNLIPAFPYQMIFWFVFSKVHYKNRRQRFQHSIGYHFIHSRYIQINLLLRRKFTTFAESFFLLSKLVFSYGRQSRYLNLKWNHKEYFE